MRSATTRGRRACPACSIGRSSSRSTSSPALLAGIAGLLYIGLIKAPSLSLAEPLLLPSVAAAVIGGTSIFGGRGGYTGTIVGALILTVLTTLLTILQMPEGSRRILFGLIVLSRHRRLSAHHRGPLGQFPEKWPRFSVRNCGKTKTWRGAPIRRKGDPMRSNLTEVGWSRHLPLRHFRFAATMAGLCPVQPAVIVIDRTRADAPAGRHLVIGFADRGTAEAYAEARTRASLERLRTHGLSAGELRRLWVQRGEECMLSDGSYLARERIDRYIAEPVTGRCLNWQAFAPDRLGRRPRRFHVTALVIDQRNRSAWVGGFLHAPERPDSDALLRHYRSDALAAFARQGIDNAEPASIYVSQLHELPDAPVPPAGQPLRNWLLEIDFVCHGVAFGVLLDAVFAWPNGPAARSWMP